MNEIYNRVANWNSQRYDREYSHELTLALLREEYDEWREATTAVDCLDGLCDIVYVAFGALWKLDLSDNQLQGAMYMAQTNIVEYVDKLPRNPGYCMAGVLDELQTGKGELGVFLCEIILLAQVSMFYMGLPQAAVVEALLIVCDSNDSKSVKKTSSDVKANDGDKGEGFIRPEPRLQALLMSVGALR